MFSRVSTGPILIGVAAISELISGLRHAHVALAKRRRPA
jgi:hypothetical protein